jgi:AcrR family transcriptional regulator
VPRTDPRGGPETRARIAGIASGLFAERGFEAVSVAEVARAAGVSSVTVFKHFPRKEDLYLDRSEDAEAFLRGVVRDRQTGESVLDALERGLHRLADERSPLSGLAPDSATFLATVAASPALVARAREVLAELRTAFETELRDAFETELRNATTGRPQPTDGRDPGLQADLVVAGVAGVFVRTARGLLAGEDPQALAAAHRARLDDLFRALRGGLAS